MPPATSDSCKALYAPSLLVIHLRTRPEPEASNPPVPPVTEIPAQRLGTGVPGIPKRKPMYGLLERRFGFTNQIEEAHGLLNYLRCVDRSRAKDIVP